MPNSKEIQGFVSNEKFNLSLLVGLKNNLEYTQNFYQTTRSLYPEAEIVFASYGSTDGTHQWLDNLKDENVKYYYSPESKSLSDTYNKCIELATKEYVIFLHNDMVLTPNFLENISKYINENTVVGFSCIEPPIFAGDIRIGKIVQDFGTDIQSLKVKELYSFSLEKQKTLTNKIESQIELLFFISVSKKILNSIKGLDNLFSPMFLEDDDLFLRLEELHLKMLTSLDAICYHFVSKTSRFSEEVIKKTQLIENNSKRNFVRKWGFSSYQNRTKARTVGLVVKNATIAIIREVEPYCSQLYVDCDYTQYIREEQTNTKFDLSQRITSLASLTGEYDILIEVDGEKFNQESLELIQNIHQVIFRRKQKIKKSLRRRILTNIFPENKFTRGNVIIKINTQLNRI